MEIEFVTLYTTFPDEDTARRVCRTLVAEGWVACANLLPMQSIYKWEEKIEEEGEVAALLKTRAELIAQIEARLTAEHPYEVPALVVWPIVAGHGPYLDWIDFATEAAAERVSGGQDADPDREDRMP
jgi:periplasmic divalent cation tolerance protein